MPGVLSKLFTEPASSDHFNCYESIHPWTPFCSQAGLDLLTAIFVRSIKIYGPVSLAQNILETRSLKDGISESINDVISSSSFIALLVYLSYSLICLTRNISGHFNLLTIFGGIFASSCATLPIESQSKINTVTILLAKAAAEAIYKIIMSDGTTQLVEVDDHSVVGKELSVLVFASSLSISLYLIKKNGYRKDALSKVLRTILGDGESKSDQDGSNITRKIHTPSDEPICSHSHSCVIYSALGFLKPFLTGYSWLIFLEASRHPFRTIRDNWTILLNSKALKFGLFLGALSATYKSLCCFFRRLTREDEPIHSLTSGFVAGLSLIIFPSNQVTLYMFWKTLFSVYWIVVKSSQWKYSFLFINGIFSLSSSLVILLYLVQPDLLPRSYVRACDQVIPTKYSGNRLVFNQMWTKYINGVVATKNSTITTRSEVLNVLIKPFTSKKYQEIIGNWTLDSK